MELNKLKDKNYSNITSLISAIIFFIIGSIIFTNPNSTVKFIAYVLGGCFIVVGLFKIISYSIAKKKEQEVFIRDLSIGIVALLSGLILVIFSNAVEVLIRVLTGAWILFNGINLLVNSIKGRKANDSSYGILIILAGLMIAGGIYMILRSNLVFKMIGLCIMVYSVIEIIGYVYYSQNN